MTGMSNPRFPPLNPRFRFTRKKGPEHLAPARGVLSPNSRQN